MMGLPIWAVLLVGVTTGAATLAGGTLILYLTSALDLILAFSAGAIIGVALFDLLPESLDLVAGTHSPLAITAAVATGFLVYLTADRASRILGQGRSRPRHFAPASLTLHSFVDGMAIGLAFHVSPAAGFTVAIGVLAHDFVDGANTVAVSLFSGSAIPTARAWLAADSVAPLAGILVAGAIAIPRFSLALLLAVFGGFFLYIGASELLPRSQARRPRLSTVVATAGGLALIFALMSLSNTL
ncbi:MAG TPA: ZIP family metal transporter [Sphingomicrobium sp.]|nr:ZIP family metal transporter [Sphingomicrobium sp.]